jgi:hypothetical protein
MQFDSNCQTKRGTQPQVYSNRHKSKPSRLTTRISEEKYPLVEKPSSVVPSHGAHSLLSVEDLAKAASLRPKRVEKFVGFGLIEPAIRTWSGPMFPRSSLERLRRIVRLSRDLGINLAGIAAVLDMRERIESLQKEVERFRERRRPVD